MEKSPLVTEETATSAPKATLPEWSVTAAIELVDADDEPDGVDEEGGNPPRGIESVHFVINGPALKAKAGYYGVTYTTANEWMGLLEGHGITFAASNGTIAIHSRRGTPREPRPAVITFEISRFGGHCDGMLYVAVPLETCRAAITSIAEVARAAELVKATK